MFTGRLYAFQDVCPLICVVICNRQLFVDDAEVDTLELFIVDVDCCPRVEGRLEEL